MFAASACAVVGRFHRTSKSGSQIRRLTGAVGGIVRKAVGQVNWEDLDGEHAFLEAVDGDEALAWVKARNEHVLNTLGHPEQNKMYDRVLSILNSKDKIPHVDKIGDFYYNFWQDESNQRGILRRTTLLEFKAAEPKWETVLDVDALGKVRSGAGRGMRASTM